MALMRGGARRAALLIATMAIALAPAASSAAQPGVSAAAATAPNPRLSVPATPAGTDANAVPDVWIFSGVLAANNETFSGTLVSSKNDAEFELKLADGATCDGSQLKGDVGLVRLSEIPCTDGRSMRALFVPQGDQMLKVFGHVGGDRFVAAAHLLGTEPPPEPPQTAEPTVPQVQPPPGLQAPPGP